MLERLKIGNFKSWKSAEVSFGKITGLFGTNSSGKSSLIQFLLLLKQTKESTDRAAALDLNNGFVLLGTPADIVHAHDESNSIDFELGYKHDKELSVGTLPRDGRTPAASSSELAIQAEVEVFQKTLKSRTLAYSVGEARFTLVPDVDDATRFNLAAKVPNDDFWFVRAQGRVWPLRRPGKAYRFPDQVHTYFQNAGFLMDLEAAFEEELDNIYYLGPLRVRPEREYLWSGSRPLDVGNRGERTIDAIIAAEDAGEMQNLRKGGRRKELSEVIAHWLRKLGLSDQFSVTEIAKGSSYWQARVKSHTHASEVLLPDVGFGVSQVLPVITLLHYVPEGSTVLLEQPEIHLHPLAQAGLADVIVHAAVHRRVQVILESHSEHLLLRLQRRVAEENINANDVALYFCDVRKGVSSIEKLALDELGNIHNWPKDFMGDAFGETARAELARIDRAIEESG